MTDKRKMLQVSGFEVVSISDIKRIEGRPLMHVPAGDRGYWLIENEASDPQVMAVWDCAAMSRLSALIGVWVRIEDDGLVDVEGGKQFRRLIILVDQKEQRAKSLREEAARAARCTKQQDLPPF